MKQVEYKIKQSTYINQSWFEKGDIIHLKEINAVLNGISSMRFIDKNGYYHSLEVKKFNNLFDLHKVSIIE